MQLGETSKQVRMIKAISTHDLRSPALSLPLKLLRKVLPQLKLVDDMDTGCITPKNQPNAGVIDRSVSCDEKRKIEVVNASEGTIREAKRQRALIEKSPAVLILKPIDFKKNGGRRRLL